jgi:hypothetical protein
MFPRHSRERCSWGGNRLPICIVFPAHQKRRLNHGIACIAISSVAPPSKPRTPARTRLDIRSVHPVAANSAGKMGCIHERGQCKADRMPADCSATRAIWYRRRHRIVATASRDINGQRPRLGLDILTFASDITRPCSVQGIRVCTG